MVIATAPAALIRWLIRACPAQEPGSRPASARGRACRRSSRPPPVLTLGERFEDIKFLIHDRGSNFTASFDTVFQGAGACGVSEVCLACQLR
jgi:hypothetical protein